MGLLGSLINWGKSAWSFITGQAGAIADGFSKLWHYITSVHNLLSWITGVPVLDTLSGLVNFARDLVSMNEAILAALARIATWILNHLIMPWVRKILLLIAQLRAKEAADVKMLVADDIEGLRLAEAYTEKLVGIERAARVADVKAARAYALALVRAVHQAIENEAASGYEVDQHERLSVVQRILDDLATRNPAVRGLVATLVRGVIDLAGIENPLARLALGVVLSRIVTQLGVDRAAGDLVSRLLGPLIADNHPKDLHDVIKDICDRLTGLEDQWADFMVHGGPGVMAAGDDWKRITGLVADGAMLVMFAQMTTDPTGWAREVASTLGAVANDAIIGTEQLIRRA